MRAVTVMCLCTVAVLLVLAVGGVHGTTIHVSTSRGSESSECGSRETPCKSVTQALSSKLKTNTTILVENGTYAEAGGVTLEDGVTVLIKTDGGDVNIELKQSAWFVNLIGKRSFLSVDGVDFVGGFTTNDGAVFRVNDAALSLSHVSIQGAVSDGNGGAIHIRGSTAIATLDRVIIRNCVAKNGGGFSVGSNAALVAYHSEFEDNTAHNFGGGGYGDDAAVLSFTDCLFARDNAHSAGGALFLADTNADFTRTSFSGSCDSYGYQVQCEGDCNTSGDSDYRYICESDPHCEQSAYVTAAQVLWLVVTVLMVCILCLPCSARIIRRRTEALGIRRRSTRASTGNTVPGYGATSTTAVNAAESEAILEKYRGLGDGYEPTPVPPADPEASEEDDPATCTICFENRIDTVLLDCGHATCCGACAVRLDKCPMCRELVARVVRIYHV